MYIHVCMYMSCTYTYDRVHNILTLIYVGRVNNNLFNIHRSLRL